MINQQRQREIAERFIEEHSLDIILTFYDTTLSDDQMLLNTFNKMLDGTYGQCNEVNRNEFEIKILASERDNGYLHIFNFKI